MRYGLFYLPTLLPATRAAGAERLRTLVDQVAHAEALGFESVWLAEHHFHSFGALLSAPAVIGAAIAQRTATIRIGTAVALLPYHNPLRVAEDYATLDCLSEGRLQFGIGHGFVKWEALTFGIALDDLRERFRENLEIILKAWSEPVLNHKGRFHDYRGVQVWPRPLQQPHPAVWMAATSTLESFELAGRRGFHLMLIPFLHETEELRLMVEAYLKARRAAGHDPSTARVIAVYHTHVGTSSAAARSVATAGLAQYHAAAAQTRGLTPGVAEPESYRSHEHHRAQMRNLTFDDMVVRNRVLVGSVAEIREKAALVRERLHLTDLAGNFALEGLADADVRAAMRRFMQEVAPEI
jgi:natural product biosynthesis luciferase-like monooxygenase protein